jgi:sugar phosphate isomerase/epimerase
MAHPISLATLTVLELAPPDVVSCAAEAGFDLVGIRVLPSTPDEVQNVLVGDTPMVLETERRLKQTGIRCLEIEIFRLKPETRVADFEGALASGARFGATEALVADDDPDEARLTDNFAAFCDLARPYGISANLESMPWTHCTSFAQALRVVTAAGRANSGVLIDAIHFDRGGSRVSEILEAPRRLLRYVQLCDAPAEHPTDLQGVLFQGRSERLMPGEGGLDLKAILRNLPKDIPLSLEIPMESLARTVPPVERARRMLNKTRQLLRDLDNQG